MASVKGNENLVVRRDPNVPVLVPAILVDVESTLKNPSDTSWTCAEVIHLQAFQTLSSGGGAIICNNSLFTGCIKARLLACR